ncbi:Holliday junction resolvase RuvX [Candidatus Saccharibacteria bacterium]|nr:Holliday junction resolvase RuvX [Candidatus Saccharibacteria bacterium]
MAAQLIPKDGFLLGLDVGNARVGVALAHGIAKIPRPYGVINNDEEIFDKLVEIINSERIEMVVVGLPRDKDGQETDQTKISRNFADRLSKVTNVPLEFADESLSSIRAESSQNYKSTSDKHFDDIAACYILEEFFGNING